MKSSAFILLLCIKIFSPHNSKAQGTLARSEFAQEVLSNLHGIFNWKMIRISTNKVIRTGQKNSEYALDSLILLGYEAFDSSNIKQVAMFGYRSSDTTFFTVELYNVNLEPNVSYGKYNPELDRIEFQENESSKFCLNIIDDSKYYWTYFKLEDQKWKERDLKVLFERKID